jgi:hypothetical protein
MQELQGWMQSAEEAREAHMRVSRFIVAGLALIALGITTSAQRQGTTPAPQPPPSSRTNFPPMVGMTPMSGNDPTMVPDVLGARMAEQQARSRNSERQKRLESDTDKLVGLVTDFKEQVSSEKIMSPADVGRKAEEIEKLAKSVKDRMRG